MKKKLSHFVLNKLNAARPNFSLKISTDFPQVKKWIFSGRDFCAGSEYLPNVTNGLILA
jgi:hypothetical protein